jgi:hypothetical protein
MSRKKKSARKPMHSHHHMPRVAHAKTNVSAQELQDRWNELRLQSGTKDHLEHILKTEGLELALAATIALTLEMNREEQKVMKSLWGWTIELFLEEGCTHIAEAGRLIIDAFLTWTFIEGPVLISHLALPLVALGLFLISCCVIYICRCHRIFGRKHSV